MNNKKNNKMKRQGYKYILLSLIILTIFWSLVSLVEFLYDYYFNDVIYGYYKEERFIQQGGLQGYTEYYKYYYTEKDDEKFYSKYEKVGKNSIEVIKLFREDFKESMILWKKLDKYDFYDIDIEENDYYLLLTDDSEKPYLYDLYYYDTETHILYVLHIS